ncbi:hypothetical protein E2C01_014470 [Portunus trituberculatus]|uniref:Uncharacterized protein n=1 Tax=Portunus trituberculatus TaxID=210409 RepID=A0A5B7DJ93_PORTR|nr:hypothetical protein [Portunus trituberculatus]
MEGVLVEETARRGVSVAGRVTEEETRLRWRPRQEIRNPRQQVRTRGVCRQKQATDILKLTTVTECQGTTITVRIQQSCMPDQFDGSPSRNGDRYEGLVNLL